MLYLPQDSHQVLYIPYKRISSALSSLLYFLHLLIEKNVSVNTFMEQTNGFLR